MFSVISKCSRAAEPKTNRSSRHLFVAGPRSIIVWIRTKLICNKFIRNLVYLIARNKFVEGRWVMVDRRPALTGWSLWKSTILHTGQRRKILGACLSVVVKSAIFTSPVIASRAKVAVSHLSGELKYYNDW